MGPEIDVDECVGQHAVDTNPEPTKLAIEFFVANCIGNEWLENLVKVAEINRVGRHSGDVGVHNLEERQCVIEIVGWRHLQEG